ncbi:DUF1843 domain-containing protein [uncultured Bradyrhizobium sp.]|uniref:DUF1843 domain-containing protein n=1 Tax=uncultured Bradyrhizobium sp. TaxID=199684 RepID=UPI0035C9455C
MSKPQLSESTPCGAAIRNAIVAGDIAGMKALVPEVEQFMSDHGNVSASLELLKIEIARFEAEGGGVAAGSKSTVAVPRKVAAGGADNAGAGSIRPYGVAIQQAVLSGELANMKAAAGLAEEWLRNHGDVAAALQALKIEIAKRE